MWRFHGTAFVLASTLILIAPACGPDGESGDCPGAGAYARLEQAERICPGPSTVLGIDVSSWQGAIDWDRVAASGVRYAYIRVAAGTSVDEDFDYNWSEAGRVGIIRGAYQALWPGYSVSDQTDLWLDKVGSVQNGELPPMVDYEVEGPNPLAKLRTWLATIEGATGVTPIIYSNPNFWGLYGSSSSEFLDYPLWIANYEVQCPDVPAPWDNWLFWQYTATGSVDGIGGNVDRDWFNGSMAELEDFVDRADCGNGVIEGDEQCDGEDLGGANCAGIGFDGGELGCDENCYFDTLACSVCGDGVIEGAEECDGDALGGASCAELGFGGGSLACDEQCAYDTSGCDDAVCGDGICAGDETEQSCPEDCLVCAPLPAAGGLLEEDGPCFSRGGPAAGWQSAAAGSGGHCYWTATGPDATCQHGTWALAFEQAGDYRLAVYIPADYGSSQQAVYRIRHAGQETEVTRSQLDVSADWLDLGQYAFAAGGDQWLALDDETGESDAEVVFDALRLTPGGDCVCQPGDAPQSRACGWCGEQIRECDGCNWGAWQECRGEGECERGVVDERTCEDGYQQRRCGQDCSWGDWGACQPESADDDKPPAGGCSQTGRTAAGSFGLLLLLCLAMLRSGRRHRSGAEPLDTECR